MPIDIEIAGECIQLRADRSLFWSRAKTLVIADPHFGKADTFRAAGLPVPGDSTEPLTRLAAAINETTAQRLAVLGDFWHAPTGRSETIRKALSDWRSFHPTLQIDLIRGNHDRASPPPSGWGEWIDNLLTPPFLLTHRPHASGKGYVLSGHLHPGIVLGRERLRLPCFWIGREFAVLPPFGFFTGVATVSPQAHDRIFAIAEREVIGIPLT